MTSLLRCMVTGVGLILLAFAPVRGDDNASGRQSRAIAIEQRLKSTFVSIDFTTANIDQAIRALAALSKQRDPDHKGINFLIQPEASTSAKPITLKLDNVPLGVALHYVCELGSVHYKIDDYFVVIAPTSVVGDDLVKRTFHVDPSFVEAASNAGVIPAPRAP